MAEQLSNTDFGSGMDDWEQIGYWEEDGGWAKCLEYIGAGDTGVNAYSIYQDISISNVNQIDVANMSADIKWEVDPGPNAYAKFRIKLKDPDGNWYTVKTSGEETGTDDGSGWANAVDVKAYLQAGGSGTWRVAFSVEFFRNSTAWDVIGWFDNCELDITWEAIGSATETITMSESTGSSAALGQSAVEVITMSDVTGVNVSVATDFRYYLGSFDGKVYLEHPAYYHDDNEAIPAHLITKVTDFSEEVFEAHNKFKIVHFIRLWYVDKSENTNVVLSVSIDEGTSWITNTKTLGSGSRLIKTKDFLFDLEGHTFQFRVENESADKDFQWIGLEIFFDITGEYFEI